MKLSAKENEVEDMLRKLAQKDADGMLEWMHDKSLVEHLQTNFEKKTRQDCERFIQNTWEDDKNLHYAVVDESDDYLGTVSLKNIHSKTAEFGIAMRKKALGQGYAIAAMRQILEMGFQDMELSSVFWCVSPLNRRAVRFYDKNGFARIDMKNREIEGYTAEQVNQYIWYAVSSEEFADRRQA